MLLRKYFEGFVIDSPTSHCRPARRPSIASSARFFCAGDASASTRAAARARVARSVIRSGKSAFPSMAFSGAVMEVPAFR